MAMATINLGERIDGLIDAERWEEARALIKKALKKEPNSHWLLTQLGETYYEERQYKKALKVLLESRDIVPDCPLTLWHLAGTLDALGVHAEAIRLYTWLLGSQKTPQDDPCWESAEWTAALKTDCVFRLGVCFQHLKWNNLAEYCFRKYIGILSLGTAGSYSVAEARKHLQELQKNKRTTLEHELEEAAAWVLQTSGVEADTDPPKLNIKRFRQLQEA